MSGGKRVCEYCVLQLWIVPSADVLLWHVLCISMSTDSYSSLHFRFLFNNNNNN